MKNDDSYNDVCAICSRHPIPRYPTTAVLRRRLNEKKLAKENNCRGDNINKNLTGKQTKRIINIRGSSVYYFEVKLIACDNGVQQTILPSVAIGFCGKESRTTGVQPGWRSDGLGYHSNNGKIYHAGNNYGIMHDCQYGPTFGGGHVVGCGVHIPSGSVLFTKNGNFIGTAFIVLNIGIDQLLPVIGLHFNYNSVIVNFGCDEEFLFDIDLVEGLYQDYPVIPKRNTTKRGRRETEEENDHAYNKEQGT